MMDMMSSKRSLNAFHSRATAPYRLSLRRLFLHLSKVSRVIPSRLFLHDIICHEHDRIPCGEGQYAEVFRAKYNDVYVSLKRLRVYQNRHNGAEDHEAFCRELLVWSQLSHANVLPLLGADNSTFRGRHCMVSPWMRNGNIHECMQSLHSKRIRIPFERWLLEISQGLEYLHAEGIIHGDLRGANILVDDYMHIRLADFGLAFFADSTTATLGSHVGGAARWMAPELLKSSQRATYASDIYSFGCLCVEVLTRKVPFSCVPSDAQVIAKVLKGLRPSRPTLENGLSLPDDLWSLLQGCWAGNPFDRPDDGAIVELMEAICSKEWARPMTVALAAKSSAPPSHSIKLLLGHARYLAGSSCTQSSSNGAVLLLTSALLLQPL
ncbi:unnamed protein product [Somion occarium]|uniref:Protein kinase domain-containing protein n=1 Tax=Somion occarium TaxID=3059160 RepID=A0ABP1D3B6_9APHY